MTDEATKTAAASTNANDEYATRDLGAAPLPPAIHEDALDVARDPELVEAFREDAGEEVDAEPVGEQVRITGDYAKADVEDLEYEVEARRAEGATINVTGTGAGGKIVKSDLIKALEADDKAKSAA